MNIIKSENQIRLQEANLNLDISYMGNLDLYWTINSKDNVINNNIFTITKENYALYELFEQLFIDIKDINIYSGEPVIPFYLEDEEEISKYLEEQKEAYRKHNLANYNKLYDDVNKTITWYSDETNHEVANILKIKKEDECFNIEFNIQKENSIYDRDFHSEHYIPIRFRNSGSSYDPFNIIFMRMFNNLKEVDDVNEIGHQICLDEYLYNVKVKKLTK